MEEPGDFFQVGGDGHGSGDDVEEDVPLGAEQHERDGTDAEPAAGIWTSAMSSTGKSAVAGTEAAICANGCAMRARRGWKPMATPTGMVQSGGDEQRGIHAQKGGARAFEELDDLRRHADDGSSEHCVEGGNDGGHQQQRAKMVLWVMSARWRESALPLRLCKSARPVHGETVIDALAQRQYRPIVQPADGV